MNTCCHCGAALNFEGSTDISICKDCIRKQNESLKYVEKVLSSKAYAHFLQYQDYYNLNLACVPFAKASTYGVFLVGSCMTKPDFRDVDVRCMLPDDQFKTMEPFVEALNASVSEWMRQRTGLSVDFQFQGMTDANLKHPGHRSALGIIS